MKFIGYFINSKILINAEEASFYELLLKHHKAYKVTSPLRNNYYVTSFDLLYRTSINGPNGKHTNESLVSAIQHKPNIVIIVHTNYDHVIAVYLHKAVSKDAQIIDNKIGLFLLRSQFKYDDASQNRILSNKTCPREILRPSPGYLLREHYWLNESGDNNSAYFLYNEMDWIGNELGREGSSKSKAKLHPFQIIELEAFQLL